MTIEQQWIEIWDEFQIENNISPFELSQMWGNQNEKYIIKCFGSEELEIEGDGNMTNKIMSRFIKYMKVVDPLFKCALGASYIKKDGLDTSEINSGNLVIDLHGEIQTITPNGITAQIQCNTVGADLYFPMPINKDALLDCGFCEIKPRDGYESAFILKSVRLDVSKQGEFYYKKPNGLSERQHMHEIQNLFFSVEQRQLKFKTLGQ